MISRNINEYDNFEALIVIKEMINLRCRVQKTRYIVPSLFLRAESGPGDGAPGSFCKGLNIEEDRGNTYTINY